MNAGSRLGPYEILAPIGAGGMGEVYRARDSKLDREVAIKVLPAALAQNPERLARFEREAKVLASLNHPNIAQIYGIEERALVMELVEGETLKGPLPVETALNCARQIADALEAAHEKGITHRDLKPANIMITPAGVVKVLDFGLAAVAQDPASGSVNPSNSPTLTMQATQAGMIMGTAAYMSPEQAAGKHVDKRADIWSFGVVLWEMLTGKRLFDGETISHTLADVLRGPIDFDTLPKETPGTIRTLLRRCLDRDVKTRLRDIGEARIAIENSGKDAEVGDTGVRHSRISWVLATVTTGAAIVLGFVSIRRATEQPPRVVTMSVLPPEKVSLPAYSVPAISPDGRQLAFAGTLDGRTGLWVRNLGSLEPRLLHGTEGASLPFWSPDSGSLGFFANGKLKKTEAAGGPVLTLCDAANGRGGTWNQNDVIVFASAIRSPLYRVPAAGGTPVPVTTLNDQEPGHRFPWFLPNGHNFLFTAYGQEREKDTVYVADLDSKSRRAILPATSNAMYVWPGYLLFLRELTLMAQPFDAAKLLITGDAVPIAEQVGYYAIDIRGMFSASQNGVLVYASLGGAGASQLTWFDRSGKMTGTIGPTGAQDLPAISPDGNSVAMARRDEQTGLADIWLYDLAHGTHSRFTFGPSSNDYPLWSPDSSHIAFFSSPGGNGAIYQRATSGAGQNEIVAAPAGTPVDWSRDGRYIIEPRSDAKTGFDIWVLPLFADKKPFPYLRTNANERWSKLSPNGQWLAYGSDESRRNEIYVQPFPAPGGKWQVSTNGGDHPVWSRDGKELFYIGADRKMMAVEVKNGSRFDAGLPKALFDTRIVGRGFDVSNDGRFLIPTQVEQSGSVPITVVLNWQMGLKK